MTQNIDNFQDAQNFVKNFALNNTWEDYPNIDKFDHVHEELIEISQHLRYKTKDEMIKYIKENKGIFNEEFGDLLFAITRLANQLGINMEKAFNQAKDKITKKYDSKLPENKTIKE